MSDRRGRKPRSGRPANVIVCIRLTDDERLDLEHVANENKTTITDVVREAVNEYVADYRENSVFHNP